MKTVLFVVIFSFIGTFNSCSDNPFSKCREDYYFSGDNLFGFEVLNRLAKENVLYIMNMKYNYDTVNVYNKDWKVALATPIGFDGSIYLRFIDQQSDKDVVDQLISKRFYVYFNYQDIDTIDVAFRMKMDKCSDQVMDYFKVSYNDSVYFDGMVRVPGASFLK